MDREHQVPDAVVATADFRRFLPIMERRTSNRLRFMLDDLFPPIIRESTIFRTLATCWLGSKAILDFKERAYGMSDREFIEAYGSIAGIYRRRASDTSENQMRWILDHLPATKDVLEVGPGEGALTRKLIECQHQVTTLDLCYPHGAIATHAVTGVIERLPFADKQFDATIAAHVVEHSRSLTRAFLELRRVTRDRVLIIAPKQRYYRITFDYHLHFFYSLEHLASFTPSGLVRGEIVDRDLCLVWEPTQSPQNMTPRSLAVRGSE